MEAKTQTTISAYANTLQNMYTYEFIEDTKSNMYTRYTNVLNGDLVETITGSIHVFGNLDLMRGR